MMAEVVTRHVDSYLFRWEGGKLRFLLLKRHRGKFYGHLWQGVAGRIERGETAVETVMREVREETGLDPARILVVDHVSSFYESHKDRIQLVPVFGVEVHSSLVRLSGEHTEFRWAGFETARELLSWKHQKEAISVLNEMLSSDDERLKWSEVKTEGRLRDR
ncbi:MAG: NUDIX pyrophosphatase [Fidelibacterota bacterium]